MRCNVWEITGFPKPTLFRHFILGNEGKRISEVFREESIGKYILPVKVRTMSKVWEGTSNFVAVPDYDKVQNSNDLELWNLHLKNLYPLK